MREAKGITVSYGPITKNYAKGLTNRRCLLIFGALLTVAGIAGFFLGTSPQDLYHMDLGQSIAYLALGVAALYVGEVWNSEYKRVFLGLEGLFFLAVGVAGFILSAVVVGSGIYQPRNFHRAASLGERGASGPRSDLPWDRPVPSTVSRLLLQQQRVRLMGTG